jgi:ESS family glutamate:Na+ symporter
METPFPFEPFLVFGTMAIFLLIGIFLRAQIGFLQRFLFPSCLIGGTLGLIVLHTGLFDLKATDFEAFAYHLFTISFISVGLTPGSKQQTEGGGKEIFRGAFWMACIEGVTISLQTIIGGLCVLLFAVFGVELFSTFGFFLPLGFTEGPGQAVSIGKTWEGFGFENAATLGLTFAAIGFLFAFFVGVPLVNWGIRKGHSALGGVTLPKDLLKGVMPKDKEKEPAGGLTMHSGNVDTLAFHLALVGLVYVLTYGLVALLGKVSSANMAKGLWGFFFFFGLMIALLIKWIMGRLGIVHLIDPGIQRRITGWAVDFLIVATVMAVQMVIVMKYLVPIVVMSILSGIFTTFAILYLGSRLPSLNLERTAVIYGTCTGTLSSGLLLLRVADPEFSTPAVLEIGFMNLIVAPVIFASMVLVNAPVWWGWSINLVMLIHVGILALCLVLIKVLKLWGSPKF